MRGFLQTSVILAVLAMGAGAPFVAAPAAATGSYSPYDESAADALARYIRELAAEPKDFNSLIGAGRAALELGDTQAAAGFFARADEVNPRSPLPQAGMGAVQTANGDAAAALPYFARAQQLGATQATLGCDRGLAYDLLGQQAQAQADYRAALAGADRDEARRRLALSLAISGDKANAIATLAPLAAKGDATTNRVRAFILALAGDPNGAMTAIDAAMPGSWARVSPFLQRLPALSAGQKAAAVNLGIFPDAGAPAVNYASAAPAGPSTTRAVASVNSDRLAGIDALLSGQPQAGNPTWQQPALTAQARPVQVAYSAPVRSSVAQRTQPQQATSKREAQKIWVQLASGPNADALYGEFQRMKSRNKDIFKGISPYMAQSGARARLVIGPFRGRSDADILTDDLQTVGIAAFRWTNSESEKVVPLAAR